LMLGFSLYMIKSEKQKRPSLILKDTTNLNY